MLGGHKTSFSKNCFINLTIDRNGIKKEEFYKWEENELILDIDDLIGMNHQLYASHMGWADKISYFKGD